MKNLRLVFLAIAFLSGFSVQTWANRYFITEKGAGDRSGDSWENAYSNDEMLLLFPDFLEDGDSLFVAAGTYTTKGSETAGNPASMFYCKNAVSIFGGYPTTMKGTDITISYPTIYETIFSGDLTGKGVVDSSCSSNFLYYFTENASIEIKGISFTNCFHSGGNNLTAYNFDNDMSDANGYGALVLQNTNAVIQWCQFYNNKTPEPTDASDGSKYYGGALNIQGCDLLHVKDCIFRDNFAARCGGAIGIKSPSENNPIISNVIVERSLFDSNCLGTAFNGKYGGAININSKGNCYVINSTFARAKYFANGGALSTGNPEGIFFVISSTLAENDDYYYYTSATAGGAYGKNLRGGNGVFRLANTINVCNKVDKYYSFTADTYNKVCATYNEKFTTGDQLTFSGYNLLGIIGTIDADKKAFVSPTDKKEVYYEDVFGKTYDITNPASTSLADNGGFSKTMIPTDNISQGMSLNEMQALKQAWNIPDVIWNAFDLTVDQRGYPRAATGNSTIGAYEKNSTQISTASSSNRPVLSTLDDAVFSVSNTASQQICVYSMNGVLVQKYTGVANKCQINLTQFEKGIYLIQGVDFSFKVIK